MPRIDFAQSVIFYPTNNLQNLIDSASGAYFYGLEIAPLTSSQTLTTSSIGSTEKHLVSFMTDPFNSGVSVLSKGVVNVYISSKQNSGTRTVTIYAKIYQSTSTGTETLLATTIASSVLTSSYVLYELPAYVGPTTLALTDRLIVRIYAIGSASGTDAQLSTQFGSTNIERVTFPAIADNAKYAAKTGWVPFTTPWTGISGSMFTVTQDWTANFRKGTLIRYKDGGNFEYGVVAASSYNNPTTTVSLIANTDYSIATGTTLTETYLSYGDNPEGFPATFNFAPNPQGFSAVPTSTAYKWTTRGKTIFIHYEEVGDGTSNATTFTATVPVAPVNNGAFIMGTTVDNSALKTTAARITIAANSTLITLRTDMANGAWTGSAGKRAIFDIFYVF